MRTQTGWAWHHPAAAALLLACLLGGRVASAAPVEGYDYSTLAERVPDTTPGRVGVVVFFRYGCQVCATVAPALTAFARQHPGDVDLVYVPVAATERDLGPARLYYTLRALGLAERLEARVYRDVLDPAVRLDLNDPAAVIAWVRRQPGIDPAAFARAYDSFGVGQQLQGAVREFARHPGGGLPAVFVDGRYLVSPGSWPPLLTDGPDYRRFRELMNTVVAMARAAPPAPAR